jgi:FkbM family methyltransferase
MAGPVHGAFPVINRTTSASNLLRRYARLPFPLLQAAAGDIVRLGRLRLRIPGGFRIRASVLAGTERVRSILDRAIGPGDTVVDVGANIGYVTCLAADRVGPAGRVIAIEPAEDNLAVLRENLRANRFRDAEVIAAAAGARQEARDLFVRGDVSAVNSLYPESCYSKVTRVVPVPVVRLDDVVDAADLVKVDVEGGELDVLDGMPRLLASPLLQLVMEWHPTLQRAAGRGAIELPLFLLDSGFEVEMIGSFGSRPATRRDLTDTAAKLMKQGRPVELFARRGGR